MLLTVLENHKYEDREDTRCWIQITSQLSTNRKKLADANLLLELS